LSDPVQADVSDVGLFYIDEGIEDAGVEGVMRESALHLSQAMMPRMMRATKGMMVIGMLTNTAVVPIAPEVTVSETSRP